MNSRLTLERCEAFLRIIKEQGPYDYCIKNKYVEQLISEWKEMKKRLGEADD